MYESPQGPRNIVDNTIREVDDILNIGVQSSIERDLILRKLYTALAISNDPTVIELIHNVEERYGKTGTK